MVRASVKPEEDARVCGVRAEELEDEVRKLITAASSGHKKALFSAIGPSSLSKVSC
jgi:hypothetical protein